MQPADHETAWNPDHAAVHVERLRGADGQLHAVLVSHPDHPFPGGAAGVLPSDTLDALRRLADAYRTRIEPLLGITPAEPADRQAPRLDWLLPTDDRHRLLGPHWVERRASTGQLLDRTLVLTAGVRAGADGARPLGGDVGLALTLHVDAVSGGFHVRITGVIASGLERLAALPQQGALQALEAWTGAAAPRILGRTLGLRDIGVDTSLPQQQPDGAVDVLLGGSGTRTTGQRSSVVAWSARWRASAAGGGHLEAGPVVEQASAATAVDFKLFGRDGASKASSPLSRRAPTRPQQVLQALRTTTRSFDLGDLAAATHVVLPPQRHDRPAPLPPTAEPVPSHDPPQARSDALAALQAFQRGNELFERYAAYLLDTAQCFRQARLPLRLRHRPVLPEAPGGDVVNARVVVVDAALGALPALEVQFGAANVSHRAATATGRPQQLGLAADPRWAWHEFGHVVIYAATGALEFPFAHSAGDALAALVAAPGSALRAPQAGLTFPWAMLTRRHDRSATLGWCWCGRRNRLRLATVRDPGDPHRHAGYVEEQLLSSSLFRAYRALGGDDPDRALRQRASDYVVYLILRAIALLPSWRLVPVRSAAQFVHALACADVGTGVWSPTPGWHSLPLAPRLGGSAYKVLRWAFEQQGLYATDDPDATREGIGQPPPVDLYLARSAGDGGYPPVPLHWSKAAPWHAGADSIQLEPPDTLSIKVCNRGALDSGIGTLRVWVAAEAPVLAWSQPAIEPLPPVGGANGAPGVQTVHVVLPGGAPADGLWVLVEASCGEDAATTDPAAGLPCAVVQLPPSDERALIDLVAGDNNLGLVFLEPA